MLPQENLLSLQGPRSFCQGASLVRCAFSFKDRSNETLNRSDMDCFYSINVKIHLAFATELFEINFVPEMHHK